jgi:hypothetical protein
MAPEVSREAIKTLGRERLTLLFALSGGLQQRLRQLAFLVHLLQALLVTPNYRPHPKLALVATVSEAQELSA